MATDNDDWADWNQPNQSATSDDSWAQFDGSTPSSEINFGSTDMFSQSSTAFGSFQSKTTLEDAVSKSPPKSSSQLVCSFSICIALFFFGRFNPKFLSFSAQNELGCRHWDPNGPVNRITSEGSCISSPLSIALISDFPILLSCFSGRSNSRH